MSTFAITRTEAVDGWTLGFASKEDEPLVRDLELGERLGFARPRRVRDLIESLARTGKLKDLELRPATGRATGEYWLTEAQTLKVIAKCETEKADAILDEVIAVYLAWRRGHLVPVAPNANSASIGDSPSMRADLRLGAERVSRARGYSIAKVYGFIRRAYRVGSPFAVLQGRLANVLSDLQQIETCVLSLYSAKAERLLEAEKRKDAKQLKLGGKDWSN